MATEGQQMAYEDPEITYKRLQNQLIATREERLNCAKEILKLDDLVNSYRSQVVAKEKLIEETILDEEDLIARQEEVNTNILLYKTLNKLLEGYKESQLRMTNIRKFEENEIYSEPMKFQAVSVSYYVPFSNRPFRQVFRINSSSTLLDVKKRALELWNLSEEIKEFKIFVKGKDQGRFPESEKLVNIFLTMSNESKRLDLILTKGEYKESEEEMEEEKKASAVKVQQKDNKKIIEYTRHFSGCSKYMYGRYLEEQALLIKKETNDEENEGTSLGLIDFIAQIIYYGLFICVFIFSILSMVYSSKPYWAFIGRENILNDINKHLSYGSDLESIITKVIPSLTYSFTIFDENSYLDKERISRNAYPIPTRAQFSFFRNKRKSCHSRYKSSKECYEAENKNEQFQSDFDTESDWAQSIYDFIGESMEGMGPQYLSTGGTNLFRSSFSLNGYLEEDVFNSELLSIDFLSLNGDYGKYKTDSANNLFLSLNYMNKESVEFIFGLLYEYFFSNAEEVGHLKSFIYLMDIYHPYYETYYHLTVKYENILREELKYPEIKIEPFIPKLPEMDNGKQVRTMDGFRLAFIIIILCFVGYQEYYSISKMNNKKGGQKSSVFDMIFKLKVITNIIIFFLFCIMYNYKIKYLYKKDIGKFEYVSQKGDNSSGNVYLFYAIGFDSYSETAKKFSQVFQLEAVIVFILCLQILIYLGTFRRGKVILNYFKINFTTVLYKIIIIIILLIFSGVIGRYSFENQEKFTTYTKGYITIFQYALYGFNRLFDMTEYERLSGFSALFLFIFIFIMLYEVYSFFPFFTDNYRVNALKYGIPYQKRKKFLIWKKANRAKIENMNLSESQILDNM
ncbi:MAG: hypothetical protein MJ252_18590 [archaeon]|nr:hypothetical protein [archaeon]